MFELFREQRGLWDFMPSDIWLSYISYIGCVCVISLSMLSLRELKEKTHAKQIKKETGKKTEHNMYEPLLGN